MACGHPFFAARGLFLTVGHVNSERIAPVLERKSEACELSIVTSVYRAAECLHELHRRLTEVLPTVTPRYEIVIVDDGSPDNAWEVMSELAGKDAHVRCVKLARNFGHHYAISAGIDHARGRRLVVMDSDLEDRPEEIPALYAKAEAGFDVVFGRRMQRTHGAIKRFFARSFYRVFAYLYDGPVDPTVGNFSVISDRVATNFRRYRERNRAYGLFVAWLGFKTGYVDITHGTRFAGSSAYTLRRQVRFAIESIVSQSNKPLMITAQLGFVIAACSVAYGVFLITRFAIWATPVEGWTSIMVSLYFLGGLILMSLGIVGVYLGKVFDETKGRPLYVVETTLNVGDENRS
jgi:dolichol-phosphate mannosyltransferase